MTVVVVETTVGVDGSRAGFDMGDHPLAEALSRGLQGLAELEGLAGSEPADLHDELLVLATIHDLHLAPLREVGAAARWQHHPVVTELKCRLEERFLARLEMAPVHARAQVGGSPAESIGAGGAVAALRALAALDQVPPVYDWLAEEATLEELREFVAIEGGPDSGFDDLVAICQVGLDGPAKLELATNYWDEMGRGDPAGVHTALHRRLSDALELEPPARGQLPPAALERTLLCSMLATNRWLQPEMIGALGLIELQAGPRCRRVAQGLRRAGAPPDALPFYDEHAVADPRHGKDWLDNVVAPLSEDPVIAAGIVRGARWRSTVNQAFYAWLTPQMLRPAGPAGAHGPG